MNVEAIYDGKIVVIKEEVAKREGLIILRKVENMAYSSVPTKKKNPDERGFIGIDELRKDLNWKKNQVISELVENFHWIFVKSRKDKNLSRKQVAKSVGVDEGDIKMIENGILPGNDFILVNKLQTYYGVNVRRDGKNFARLAREAIAKESSKDLPKDVQKETNKGLFGEIDLNE